MVVHKELSNDDDENSADIELGVQMTADVVMRLDGIVCIGREVVSRMNAMTDNNGDHKASS